MAVTMAAVPLWLLSFIERVRASLFFLPMVAVLTAIGAALAGIWIDSELDDVAGQLPLVLSSTVDNARSILSTVAAATISFAGIAFSVSLLVIQQTSNQHSPRVVHTLFRDPFNRRVMALVVGTFTYCVVVLRSVRSPLEDGGEAVVPNLSVAVALLLGISAILATVAFINHSAHSMDVSEILDRATRETISHVRHTWTLPDEQDHTRTDGPAAVVRTADPPTHVIRFRRRGWVQAIDVEAVLDQVPDGGSIALVTSAGRYALEGAPLAQVRGSVADPDELDRAVCEAVVVGPSRTMQQDSTYGLRQVVDVALRALSPGVNDPTTAQDAIFHAAAILSEQLRRDPSPTRCATENGGQLLLTEEPTHDDLVRLAFDEVRRAAAPHPTVCIYLLEAIHLVRETLDADGPLDRVRALEVQARLVRDGSEAADSLPEDRALVRAAYTSRFEVDRFVRQAPPE